MTASSWRLSMTSSTSSLGTAKSSALRRLTASARAADSGRRASVRKVKACAWPPLTQGRQAAWKRGEMREVVIGEIGREVPLEGERILR